MEQPKKKRVKSDGSSLAGASKKGASSSGSIKSNASSKKGTASPQKMVERRKEYFKSLAPYVPFEIMMRRHKVGSSSSSSASSSSSSSSDILTPLVVTNGNEVVELRIFCLSLLTNEQNVLRKSDGKPSC